MSATPTTDRTRYIFVTGGVVSSLGKGIAAASLGLLLKERGLRVTLQKLDPYINVDPGTMSPFQHGEVFVTDDGAETDLDLGHYERFIDANLHQANNTTTGRIYQTVIARERRGDYLGRTVQVVPHITDEIKQCMYRLADGCDVVISEVGGTVGDIESLPFLEAIRQFRQEVGHRDVVHVHLTLVPYISAAGELKTKPTQHSVRELMQTGIQPSVLICRTERPLDDGIKAKIASFTNVAPAGVVEALDVETIYEVPLELRRQRLDDFVLSCFGLDAPAPDLTRWKGIVQRIKSPSRGTVRIAVVGKYTELVDAYKSVQQALIHGGIAHDVEVAIDWVRSEELEDGLAPDFLAEYDGLLVPGGFGDRGIDGMVTAIRWARENALPFLGICLGLQCAVIEFARTVCGLEGAHSFEFDAESPHPVICLMDEQRNVITKGGTMRLGSYDAKVLPGTRSEQLYGASRIVERHRHRYEVNNAYRETLAAGGLVFSATSLDGQLVEMIELPDHPWFVAGQFHPELKSRPTEAHPLFAAFVGAGVAHAAGCAPGRVSAAAVPAPADEVPADEVRAAASRAAAAAAVVGG